MDIGKYSHTQTLVLEAFSVVAVDVIFKIYGADQSRGTPQYCVSMPVHVYVWICGWNRGNENLNPSGITNIRSQRTNQANNHPTNKTEEWKKKKTTLRDANRFP